MSRKSIFFSIIAILAFILVVIALAIFMVITKPDKTKPIRHGNIISNITCPATKGASNLTQAYPTGFGPKGEDEPFIMETSNSSQAKTGYSYDFRKLYIFPVNSYNDTEIRIQPDRRQMFLVCSYHGDQIDVKFPGRALGCNDSQETNLSCSTEVDADFPRDWQPVFK